MKIILRDEVTEMWWDVHLSQDMGTRNKKFMMKQVSLIPKFTDLLVS